MNTDRVRLGVAATYFTCCILAAVGMQLILYRAPPPPIVLTSPPVLSAPASPWSVFFSPHGGCTDALVAEIGRAKRTIHVQAYSFTSQPISASLQAAVSRGVDVEVIVDADSSKSTYCQAGMIAQAGGKVWKDSAHAIAHNKVMVFDAGTVATGSFNLTHAGEASNAENLLIVRDKELALAYLKNFERHREHSEPWKGGP